METNEIETITEEVTEVTAGSGAKSLIALGTAAFVAGAAALGYWGIKKIKAKRRLKRYDGQDEVDAEVVEPAEED